MSATEFFVPMLAALRTDITRYDTFSNSRNGGIPLVNLGITV